MVFVPVKQITFSVSPQWQQYPIELNKPYFIDNDTLEIQQWKCYLHVCALYNNNEQVYAFPNAHHLLDASNPSTFQWSINIPSNIEYNSVAFEIGVDSTLQMQGVQGQELDPENDMYWSWQSGYIHTKLEATSHHPKRQFTLHIGGYRAPFNTLNRFRINVSGDALHLVCPIDTWIDYARKQPLSQIMKPGAEAQQMANAWAKTWYVQKP